MKISEVLNLQWKEFEQNPLIRSPFPSWLIADPTFLSPECAPDGKWHLFAHSLMGIHHFISSNGVDWSRLRGLVTKGSIRAYLHKTTTDYYLFYERLVSTRLMKYTSRIEVRVSKDLTSWSGPNIVFEPRLLWHREGGWLGNVGNPCVIADEDGYRLYYTAGLIYLKDCGFYEPKYIGCAFSKALSGPYVPMPDPVLTPEPDDPFANLGAGAIKVLRCSDGYVGFQNGIYWDRVSNHSGSAIRILESSNGKEWEVSGDPILKPDRGWKKSHVYALDVRLTANGWRLYFNARSGWLVGRESIGLAYGEAIDAAGAE